MEKAYAIILNTSTILSLQVWRIKLIAPKIWIRLIKNFEIFWKLNKSGIRKFRGIEHFGKSKFSSRDFRGIETLSIFLGLIGISIMINLPSAIKLIFYLIQCAISYSLLYLGHGVDIFDNLDIILYIVGAHRTSVDGNSYTLSTDDYSIMPSLWSSIPAITVWVVALFLVSTGHSTVRSIGVCRLCSAPCGIRSSLLDRIPRERPSTFIG